MNWGDSRIPDRIWALIVTEPNSGRWLWTGGNRGGKREYGRVWLNGALHYAHRLTYQIDRGPILDEHVIDHLCRTPSCCNPAHLEQVTQSINLKRSDLGRARGCVGHYGAMLTHCKDGHPFDAVNTHFKRNGRRVCRACARERARRIARSRKEMP